MKLEKKVSKEVRKIVKDKPKCSHILVPIGQQYKLRETGKWYRNYACSHGFCDHQEMIPIPRPAQGVISLRDR